MENFTKSISDDFGEMNGMISESNGVLAHGCNGSDRKGDEGTPARETAELDIDSLLKGYRRKRSRQLEHAPEFVKRLNAFVEVKAGDDVTFACQWKAFPNPQIKWYRDDEDITESERYTKESNVDGTETLTLVRATKKDEGAYKCKVENQEGVASTTGYLSVTGDIAEKPLSSQPRKVKSDHTISSAPHLRTIVEQKSVEEREGDAASSQDPSPLQDFIDNFRREKTWPMCGTGYDMLQEGGVNGDTSKDQPDNTSNGSDTSCDSQDYDRVSVEFKNKDNLTNEGALEKAPSVEDIIGNLTMESSEKVENFLHHQSDTEISTPTSNTLPKFDFDKQSYNSPEEDDTTTPTNFLDEPVFSTSDSILPKEESYSAPTHTHVRGKSQTPEIELGEIPRTVSRVFADQLDLPWIYFFLFTTCSASFAVSIAMPVPYFVMMIAIVSLISFRFIS